MTNTCEHGHFARSCDVCFYTKRVGELEAEVRNLRKLCVDSSKRMREMALGWGVAKRNKMKAVADVLANEGSKEHGR